MDQNSKRELTKFIEQYSSKNQEESKFKLAWFQAIKVQH